jgi:hypothetical protein
VSLTPRYPVASDHPRLSAKGQALSPDALSAEVVLAETILGVHSAGPNAGTDEADEVTLAIVLQINFQLAQGIDPQIVESINTRDGTTQKFRDRYVDPKAAAIVERILLALQRVPTDAGSGSWPIIRSYRTNGA